METSLTALVRTVEQRSGPALSFEIEIADPAEPTTVEDAAAGARE
jgi:hypothetical protein